MSQSAEAAPTGSRAQAHAVLKRSETSLFRLCLRGRLRVARAAEYQRGIGLSLANLAQLQWSQGKQVDGVRRRRDASRGAAGWVSRPQLRQ